MRSLIYVLACGVLPMMTMLVEGCGEAKAQQVIIVQPYGHQSAYDHTLPRTLPTLRDFGSLRDGPTLLGSQPRFVAERAIIVYPTPLRSWAFGRYMAPINPPPLPATPYSPYGTRPGNSIGVRAQGGRIHYPTPLRSWAFGYEARPW